jgi:hypothetical protein
MPQVGLDATRHGLFLQSNNLGNTSIWESLQRYNETGSDHYVKIKCTRARGHIHIAHTTSRPGKSFVRQPWWTMGRTHVEQYICVVAMLRGLCVCVVYAKTIVRWLTIMECYELLRVSAL